MSPVNATPNILFSRQVVKTLRELPENKREKVTQAIIADFILGQNSAEELPEFEYLIYSMIAENIKRDSYRYDRSAV